VLVCGTAFALVTLCGEVAHAEGKYQSTKNGKTLVWNGSPKPGDIATWSGDRDRSDYARGFGRLIWYATERGTETPQLYARYWGRMVDGKFEGPVNVHAKKTTRYAIFVDGLRVTAWSPGAAPIRATARWRTLVAKRNRSHLEPERREPAFAERQSNASAARTSDFLRSEPEAPAAGPAAEKVEGGRRKPQSADLIQDLYYTDRWPKLDIDESLRLLAFPPRTLRK